MKGLKYIACMVLIAMAFSCKKKEEDPNLIPTIEFQSISATAVVEFDNILEVSIKYEDENGDLGHTDPDVLSIWVKDDRLEEADMYHLQPLTPNEDELHIRGSFKLELNTLFILGNADQETTKFSIKLTDRAGNVSNTITTPVVTIARP